MPIKKENKALYPPPREWKAIREEVLARAGNKCEWEGCGLPNGQEGIRDMAGKWWSFDQFLAGEVPDRAVFENEKQEMKKSTRIVLTIMHLDHNPANNGEPGNRPNLLAACQYHHLKHDHPHHMVNARKTRAQKNGLVNMFEVTA